MRFIPEKLRGDFIDLYADTILLYEEELSYTCSSLSLFLFLSRLSFSIALDDCHILAEKNPDGRNLITFDPIKCFSFIKLAKRVGWRRLAADSQELLLLFGFEKPQHHVREIFSTCLKLSHFHPGEICIPSQ